MKMISAGLLAHLSQDSTTLATCVKLTRRDGVVMAYTTHDQPLTFDCDGLGAVTYKAEGSYRRSALDTQLGLSADTVELDGILQDDAIDEDDILNGIYDQAELKIMLVNWSNVTQGVLKLRRGYVGQMTLHRETYVAEIRGLMDLYSTVIGELYTPDCRADLGDARCQFPLAPAAWAPDHAYGARSAVMATGGGFPLRTFFTLQGGTSGASEPDWDATLLATTTDGTCTWRTHLASTVLCTVSLVEALIAGEAGTHRFQVTPAMPEFDAWPSAAMVPWFAAGQARWLTGANAGSAGEIKAWFPATTPGSTVHLTLATALPIQVGDTLQLVVGCDKRRVTCVQRFTNIVNFRGEPWIPGLDTALLYPSPHPV